jgi:hypothetical protein
MPFEPSTIAGNNFNTQVNPAVAAAATAPILLWDHDFTADPDADWNAAPPATIDGLTVTITESAAPETPTTWGPAGGNGLTMDNPAATTSWGRLEVGWPDIGTDLMNRALTRADTLIFCSQHAVASWSIVTGGSKVVMEVFASPPDENSAWGPLDRIGGNNRSFRYWPGGWPPVTVLQDAVQIRGGASIITTGSCLLYSTDNVLDTTAPPVGGGTTAEYGPIRFLCSGEVALGYDIAAAGAGRSRWDFESNNGGLWWMLQSSNGETAPILLERAQIWLLPGTPNVAP